MQQPPYGHDPYDERPRARVMRSKKGQREQARRESGRGEESSGRARGKRRFPFGGILALVMILCLAGAFVTGAGALEKKEKADAMVSARLEAEAQYAAQVQRHAPSYSDLIVRYAAEYELEPAFVAAVIYRESHFDPRAVSSKNAKGLMQFMPDTFDWVAPNCGISRSDTDAVFVPENAIRMGCYLLRYIIREMGTDDPILLACAYHAGWGNVDAWLQKYSGDGRSLKISEIPMEDTRVYAERVVDSYAVYLQHYYPSGGASSGAGHAAVRGGAL